nr:MAG TPA: hypothetical protein [Caudoviricetes sp.]
MLIAIFTFSSHTHIIFHIQYLLLHKKRTCKNRFTSSFYLYYFKK